MCNNWPKNSTKFSLLTEPEISIATNIFFLCLIFRAGLPGKRLLYLFLDFLVTTLSDDDCTTIRVAYDTGSFSYQMLADKFDCSKSTIRDIIKERTRFSDRMRR